MSFSELRISIDLRAIADSPFQDRKDYREIETLANSIREEGLLQAPVVRLQPSHRKRLRKAASYEKKVAQLAQQTSPAFELAFGHRRIRALLMLAQEDVSFLQQELLVRDLSDAQMQEIALVENLQREAVHPYHRARSIASMVAQANGATAVLARKLGQSKRWVVEHLRYLELAEEVIDFWLSDILQLAQVNVLLKYPPEMQRQALKQLVDEESEWDEAGEKRIVTSYSCHRTAQDFIRFFERRAQVALEKAAFDLSDTSLHPEERSCLSCPHNTCNQASLFPEVSAESGLCTQPTCFGQKSKALLLQHLDQLREQGREIRLISTSYYGNEALAQQYEGEPVLTREDYATQLQAANGTQLAPHALGIYCDWADERFMTEVPIVLKGEHRGAIDPTLESWREGYDRKLVNREQRRQSQLRKEARQIDLEVVHELARLPLPEQMPDYLIALCFSLLYRQLDSESIKQINHFVGVLQQENDLNLPPVEVRERWDAKAWITAVSPELLRKFLRLILLLTSATSPHAYGEYLVKAELGKEIIREQIEARQAELRDAKWAIQDEKSQQEFSRYQKRMEQLEEWALDPDSFAHKVLWQSDWQELQTYLRISAPYVRKTARSLGIKLKKDATPDEIVRCFQQYQSVLLREYEGWKQQHGLEDQTTA
ncbi:MAG: ParB/RepB/Spo0J family partition protein [Bacteroidota bacterium]